MSRKELSFVPPDGTFVLMEYRVAKSQGSGIGASTPPISLKPSINLTEDGGDVY
jgi:AP-3 complex subunit mu